MRDSDDVPLPTPQPDEAPPRPAAAPSAHEGARSEPDEHARAVCPVCGERATAYPRCLRCGAWRDAAARAAALGKAAEPTAGIAAIVAAIAATILLAALSAVFLRATPSHGRPPAGRAGSQASAAPAPAPADAPGR